MVGHKLLLLAAVLAMLATPQPNDALGLDVKPRVANAPATIRILALVRKDPENDLLVVAAASEEYFRSSNVTLEGEYSPRQHTIVYDGLPPGHYLVTATVQNRNGKLLAEERLELDVLGP